MRSVVIASAVLSAAFAIGVARSVTAGETGHLSFEHLVARADVIVGANGQWRLCAKCADLSVFNSFRSRRSIP